MMRNHLKVYRGPEDTLPTNALPAPAPATVTAPVSEVLPLLADAIENQRTWLADFEDDEITLSSDLYEVLLAYQFFRRPSA